MSAIFLKILNMSITASWLILAVVVLRLFLKKAPKWISCLLWAIVALRLVCPFTFESVLSLVPSKEPIPTNIVVSHEPTVEIGIPAIDAPVNTVIADSFTPAPSDSANPLQILVPVLAAAWLMGIVILLIYALISYIRLRMTVSASFEKEKGVKACDDVKAPFILGIFRPVIYIPSGMNDETLDYVLKHERAHLARHDHWWKPLGFLLLTVYWFNPLCWVAYILLCRDIESACDEKVIRDMDKPSMAAYSQALLDCSFSRKAIAACPLAFGEVGVKERIKGVLNYKKPAFWIIIVALIACAVVSVCFLTNPKDEQDLSMLNYKNAISTVADSEGIEAIHHGVRDDGTTYTELTAPNKAVSSKEFAGYLDKANWKKRSTPADRPGSDNSVEFIINDSYIITVYGNPGVARVYYEGLERYYSIGVNDYAAALDLFNSATILSVSFIGTVTDIYENEMLVTPEKGSEASLSSDCFSVPLKVVTDFTPEIGDTIEISYDGYVLAVYPATFSKIFSVNLISREIDPYRIINTATYVGWNDNLVVWDEALNRDTVILSDAIHLPVYKLESVQNLEAFEKKFENTMDFDVWHDNEFEPFDVAALDFNEDFFEEYTVLITYMSAGSGSFRYEVRNVSFDGNTLCVNVVRTVAPDVYTDDMAGWLMLTEIPKSYLDGIEKYDAIFAGDSENIKTSESQIIYPELQDFEHESVISTFTDYDVTHDGVKDIIQVSYITVDGFSGKFTEQTFHNGSLGFVKVFDGAKGTPQNSSPIYECDYSRVHVGNRQFFITTIDDKDYFVETSLWSGQGLCNYSYYVFSFENGDTHTIDMGEADFEYGTKHAADDFFEQLYKWINDDSLLLMAADIELDFTFYSTSDNTVNPDEYYHRKKSNY